MPTFFGEGLEQVAGVVIPILSQAVKIQHAHVGQYLAGS